MDLKLVGTDLVSVKEMEFIQELDGFRFPNRVYKNYIWSTKGNMALSYKNAKKKLIRNIVLGTEAPRKKGLEYKRVFYYGGLAVHINIEEKSICYVKNEPLRTFPLRTKEDKIHILNDIMGIKNNIKKGEK